MQKMGKSITYFRILFLQDPRYNDYLFAEHFLFKNNKPILLVKREKTAIVCAIHFTNFNWLSYRGVFENKIVIQPQ
jgi:hypothetical protein